MATNRVAQRSVQSSTPHAAVEASPPRISAKTKPAVAMQRGRQIAAITGGKHPKIARTQPVARALNILADANAFLMAPDAATTLLEHDSGAKCRTAVFAVESLMRMAKVRFGSDFEKHFGRVKALEDGLGKLGHAQDMVAHAKRSGALDVVIYWQHEEATSKRELSTLLQTRWLPSEAGDKAAMPKIARAILNADWNDGKHDRRDNAKALAYEAERVVSKELDMTNLDAMHELRRTCRWFAILARALNGAVVLTDENPPAKYRAVLNEPIAKSPFASLPVSRSESYPVTVPRAMFVATAKIIDAIGELKDKREAVEGITQALQDTRGLSEQQAHGEALKLLGFTREQHDQWIARASEIHPQAQSLFRDITAVLRAQA